MRQLLHKVLAVALTLVFLGLFMVARVLVCFYDETCGNCLVYSLRRLHRDGGACIVTWSRWGPWPHVEWASAAGDAYSYDPIDPKFRHTTWLQLPLWFRGRARSRRVSLLEEKRSEPR